MHDTAQKQWSRSWIFVAEVFSGNQIAIEIRKFELKFNKPIYVGMIYSISKICLYEFHHEYVTAISQKM